jgi:hypothetical protein
MFQKFSVYFYGKKNRQFCRQKKSANRSRHIDHLCLKKCPGEKIFVRGYIFLPVKNSQQKEKKKPKKIYATI